MINLKLGYIMNLNKLEIKRQSLELQFSNIFEKIDDLEYKKFEIEQVYKTKPQYPDNYYHNKMDKIDEKIYRLEDKQGKIQEKIDSIMIKLNITY